MSMIQVTPRGLRSLLAKTIPAGLPVLVTGMPGIGKTAIINLACKDAGADMLIDYAALMDPTDAKGLPFAHPGDAVATFLPFGNLAAAAAAKKPLAWFLDDIGQGTPSVQASLMNLIQQKRVNGKKLPDCVSFIAATNRRQDKAGVSGILEPVKSRFVTIVELVADLDDFCEWAAKQAYFPAMLIAFLRSRSDLLAKFEPSADMTNSPLPRTWEHVARIEALDLPAPIEAAAMAGAVGETAATDYLVFRRMAASLVNIDSILASPGTARVPSNPAELYATVVGLAARTTVQTFAAIATYAQRLMDAQHGEFSALLLNDCVRRDAKVKSTPAFKTLALGPLGTLISGN